MEYTKVSQQGELTAKTKSLSILHILFSINETSAPYNEHCLSLSHQRDITVCTYFKSKTKSQPEIEVFEGNNSLTGFFQVLKKVLVINDYDIIHIHALHLMVLFQLVSLMFLRKFFRNTVFTVHTSYQNYKFIHRLMLIPSLLFARRVVCCSKSSYDSLPRFYRMMGGKRLRIVRNGVDLYRIDNTLIQERKGLSKQDRFLITSVGRLITVKNPFSLLKAFLQSTDFESSLRFIGEGHLRQQLQNASKMDSFNGKIEFMGLIPREQVYRNLADTDLFVSTSYVEGFPVAALEAMACSCPVLLSDIAPHREIAEGVDFIPLIHPDNADEFADEIKRFYKMTDSERKKIGQKCRKLVEERFSLKIMHQGYNKIYDEIRIRQ